ILLFVLGVWLWRRVYSEDAEGSDMQRIAKNSVTPIALNLFNRLIQFGFAIVYLRILGPEGSGNYTTAVVTLGLFDILTNFGLNTYLIREVARDKNAANRYFSNTTILRLGLALIGVPLVWLFITSRQLLAQVSPTTAPFADEVVIALWLLYGGLFFSTMNAGLTAVFYAFEKAEYPSALQTVSTLLSVSLGLIALLLGYGIVGLAAVSIVVNIITFGMLMILTRQQFFRPRMEFEPSLSREAMGESFPLMLNHLLATLFFRIDVLILEALRGPIVVGWYGVTYKWIDAINVIPAFFTQALFPVMSRQAVEDKAELHRTYVFSVKLLTLVSLPVAVITTLLATFLVGLLAGAEFLPDGAIALQIFVWSIPIGWINSVTNYVIIAINRQRILTIAFVVGAAANVVLNLVFIPLYSYRAAAVVTIFSEFLLLVAFYIILARGLAPVPWVKALWRLAASAAVMGGVAFALAGINVFLAASAAGLSYMGAVWLLRPFDEDEQERLISLIPERLRGGALPIAPAESG
ncbi:MAG: flippase, partial [Chloroflexi bacterium]|nr:flippase [Chloroflexota bacterium]